MRDVLLLVIGLVLGVASDRIGLALRGRATSKAADETSRMDDQAAPAPRRRRRARRAPRRLRLPRPSLARLRLLWPGRGRRRDHDVDRDAHGHEGDRHQDVAEPSTIGDGDGDGDGDGNDVGRRQVAPAAPTPRPRAPRTAIASESRQTTARRSRGLSLEAPPRTESLRPGTRDAEPSRLALAAGGAPPGEPVIDADVLDIGPTATMSALRTRAAVDLGLHRTPAGWALHSYSLGSATAQLGPLPVRTGALTVTDRARLLEITHDDGDVEVVDLSPFVSSTPQHGRVTIEKPRKGSVPGLSTVTFEGVVAVVAVSAPRGAISEEEVHSLDATMTAYPYVWSGDPSSFAIALRQDLLTTLERWPLPPGADGLAIEVAVAGPGPTGPTWATAGDGSLAIEESGDDLLVTHDTYAAIGLVVDGGGDR